jgi:hypothetical protein
MVTVAQNAQQVAAGAGSVSLPAVDEVTTAAESAVTQAVSASGAIPASQLLGVGADAIVTGLTQSPFVAPEPAAEPQRGFLASLLLGLFKAFAWLMLFLGIAVVLLRIRAVRRQKLRRAAAMRRRAEQQREPVRVR